MNAYDFDETIYDGDSTRDFYFYCLRRFPKVAKFLPMQGAKALSWKVLKKIDKTTFKENFYRFFTAVPDIDAAVADFWDGHFQNIKSWYLAQKKADDLIISASPEFLLRPACDRLGLCNLIASRVDKKTGAYTGENCWGKEKVHRLYEEIPYAVIDDFYSDSLSDTPMAMLAERDRFIVRGDVLIPWDEYRK